MKVSLNWLKNYVDLDASVDEICEALPMIGLEVESVETKGMPQIDNLVVGEVLSREQHPNADKLGVCMVKFAPDAEPTQIVCGASNYKVGDRIPVALVGAKLPGDFKIKKSKLRGVESNGMMCSAKELGLGDDHSGLMILTDRPEIGTPMNDIFKDSDTVIELELTANRGDCLSHIGVARELAAYFGKDLKTPEVSDASGQGNALISGVEVTTDGCPYYTARSIKGVKIAESPEWLKKALTAIGQRPINNVVDVTNYVLMETGQPLHAFDAGKIKGGKIIVRQAKEGEPITTLDEKERKLSEQMMVIADAKRPLVVAGVMGSLDAEVDDNTVDIVLESAWFQPGSVRWTTRRLNLFSDSSHRFTRDVDPAGVEYAAKRAIDLILEVAGGEVVGDPIVVGEPPRGDRTIDITGDYVRQVCGFTVKDAEIESAFKRLGFVVQSDSASQSEGVAWQVTVPSFRPEVDRPIDLVEEFVRLYGTAKIPEGAVKATGLTRDDAPLAKYNRLTANFLASNGFAECSHYTLVDGDQLGAFEYGDQYPNLKLANPLTSEMGHLRASLIPGLVKAAQLNQSRGNSPTRFFETGRVFRWGEGEIFEIASIAFLWRADGEGRQWRERGAPDFYSAKAMVENLLGLGGFKTPQWDTTDHPAWQAGQSGGAGCWFKGQSMVRAGLLDMQMLKAMEVDGLWLGGEILFLAARQPKSDKATRFQGFSDYPGSEKDLALVVDAALPAEDVRKALAKAADKSTAGAFGVEAVEVFDVYTGTGLPEGKKSLAFSIRYRSPERTLKDKEVNSAFDAVQKAMKEAGYEVRG
ncbi:phenylalanine--tRNA ligase subunit beta [Cerasicoccus fimbriatus]|uniref:phenylalanine--tRNA ligase subunit beta n=1 Tax=Cerasicoccus fimbriatus TaxID=3014554 RepID=UPI0022B37896|nr:phenylalanine--tRNA ligase subunit beta [Cerasicoccus sp. TK19100]